MEVNSAYCRSSELDLSLYFANKDILPSPWICQLSLAGIPIRGNRVTLGRQAMRKKSHSIRRPLFLTFNHGVNVCYPKELNHFDFSANASLVIQPLILYYALPRTHPDNREKKKANHFCLSYSSSHLAATSTSAKSTKNTSQIAST